MKKFFLSMIVMVLAAINVNADVITWDFSKFADQVTLSNEVCPLEYDGLALVGTATGLNSKSEVSEYVSATAGFHCNGTSSATTRYIMYTPTENGTMTVTYRSNNTSAKDRITAIGTSVVKGTDVDALLANDAVLAGGLTDGATAQTISAELTAGTTYYIYFANGGQSITKLEYEYTAAKPSYATICVDNVDLVKIVDENRTEVNLGTQSPCQIETTAFGNYMITSKVAGYTLNKVELNGEEVKAPYGYYAVTLAAGDYLNITAAYTPAKSKVEFSLPYRKNTADVVKTVAYSGGEVIEGWPTGMFEAANGYKMVITLDEDKYQVDSVLVNGVKLTGSYGAYTIKNITEYTSVEIFAINKPVMPVVIVDNANKVKMLNENREEQTLVAGTQSFSAGNYMIQPKVSGYTLNKVELNGEVVKLPYAAATYYQVSLAEGDTLAITADYTPANSKVLFELPYRKNTAGVVKSVTHSGATEPQITEWPTGIFEAANGYKMTFVLDETSYIVDSVLVNGVKVKGSYGSYSTTVKEYTDVEIFAVEKPVMPVVIVDNANKVKMLNENREEQTLVAGTQSFSAGNYMIQPKVSGYTLNKVELNGEVVKLPYAAATYYQVSLAEGDTLAITADYTPANSKVLFELPYRKNTAGVVKSVTHSGATEAQITEWPTGMFEAANGYKMTFVLDETSYIVDSVLVNGVKVKGSYGSYSTTVKEYTDVEIFALPIDTLNAKIVCANIPDMTQMSDYASVHKGGSAYGEEISIENGTTKFWVLSNNNQIVVVPASGKKVYVAVNNALVDADATTGYFTVAVNDGDEIKVFPEIEFTANPENNSTVENIDKVTLTFPGFLYSGADYAQAIYDNAIMDAEGNYVKNENGENIKGTLTWGDDMNQLVWQGGNKVTTPGTYTIVIPAGALRFGDVNIQPLYITYTIAAPVVAPVLQMTYPQANTTVNELPDYVTFMFDQEVQQPYACAIQNGYNDPIVIEPVNYSVIDGNTVKIVLTDKVKEQLGTLTADGVTVYVQLTETQQYDTHFTVAPEFAVESSTFTTTGGQIIFNQNVDFVDPEAVTCYVSGVKTKNIATQATLSLDDDNYAAINVAFAEALPAGDYTLDIPDGMIKSTAEEPLASVKLPFTIKEAPVFAVSVESYTGSYYEGKTVDAPLTDILAAINATSMDDVTIYSENPDGTRVNSVRGETDGWRNADGGFEYWGDNAYFYVQDNDELPGAQYYVGGYPGKTDAEVSYTAKLVYVNNTTNDEAILNVTLNYVPAPKVELSVVATVETSVEYTVDEGPYTEKVVSLNDYQVYTITSKIGVSKLDDATAYGYNPTTKEFVADYAKYDGWRDVNGDFTNWTGDATTAPFCVKYDNGKDYYCYNLQNAAEGTTACYWAIANAETGKAALVKVNFKYSPSTGINNIFAGENSNVAKYNLAGQRVNANVKGIVIMNGKKYTVK